MQRRMSGRGRKLSAALVSLWLGTLFIWESKTCEAALDDAGATLLFNTASRLYRQENWREAAAVFENFLKEYPRHKDAPEARFARGLCLHRVGQSAAAATELRRAAQVKSAPWLSDAHFYLGRTLEELARREDQPAARVETFRDAARHYGLAAKARREAHGELPKSSAKKRQEQEIFIGYVQAVTSQAEAQYHAGEHAQTVATISPLLRDARVASQKSYPRALYFLALSHDTLAKANRSAAKNHRDAAVSALRKLSADKYSKHPLWEEALYLLARRLQDGGDYTGAVREYGRLIQNGGDRATESEYHRAIALFRMGDSDSLRSATDAFAKFHADHPRHALAGRALFYAALGDFNRQDYTSASTRLQRFLKDPGAKKAGTDLVAQASLSLGQSLLLQESPNASLAAKLLAHAIKASRTAVSKVDNSRPATVRLAQAVFWHGQALLQSGAATEATSQFAEVSTKYAELVPELAEESRYKKAVSLFHASRHKECAAALHEYRRHYPRERGRFYFDSLELSGRNAMQASPGKLTSEERQRAPEYYESAAALAGRPADTTRLRYLAGAAYYYNGAFPKAAKVLAAVYEALPKAQRSAGEYADLTFLLADALTQLPRPEPLDAASRQRVQQANALYREYLQSVKGATAEKELRYGDSALMRLGYTHQWLGELERARPALMRFLKVFATHPEATNVRFQLANLQAAAGDAAAAVREFRTVARRTKSWDIAVNSLLKAGSLLSQTGQPAESSEVLLAALKRIPPRHRQSAKARQYRESIQFNHAMNLLDAEETPEAKRALAEFVEAFPDAAGANDARVQLAYLQLDDKDPQGALRTTAPLVVAGAQSGARDEALYIRAWCFAQLADVLSKKAKGPKTAAQLTELHKKLVASYQRLIENHPDSPLLNDATLELAQHHYNHQAPAEAKKWFLRLQNQLAQAVGPSPDSQERKQTLREECLYGLAYLAFEEKDYVTARGLFDDVAKRRASPLAPRSLFQAGRSWMLGNRDAEAIKRFRILVEELAPRARNLLEETYLRLGESHHRLREYPQAIAVLKRQLKEFPEGHLRFQGRFVLGFAYQFSDQFKEATENFRQVVKSTDGVVAARAQYHLGECFMDQGKFREAAREFITVVANFDHESAGYRKWLRRALLAAGNAYSAAGDAKAASREWRELLQRFPKTDEAKAAASKLEQVQKKSNATGG